MGFIVLFIVLTVAGGVVGIGGLFVGLTGTGEERFGGFAVSFVTAILYIFIVGGVGLGNSYHSVPTGHVGIVYGMGGDITGQRSEGVSWTWPWQGFKTATIQGQTLCFMDETEQNKCPQGSRKISAGLDSFSKETQNVYIDVILNIRVDPRNIQTLYREWGDTYVTKLIPGRVEQIFKDETVKYQATELAPHREDIKNAVQTSLRTEMGQFSIDVVALNLANIQYDQAFEDAILAKQTATQEALKQHELVAAKQAEAEQKAAEAEGTANQLRITAQGQADANNLINASITPLLLQWQAVQKLADNVSIALVPSGQGLIIDPSKLFGTAP